MMIRIIRLRLPLLNLCLLFLFFGLCFWSKTVQAGLSSLRGASGDLVADIIIGQPDFAETLPGRVVPFKLFRPGGVIVDRSIKPNRIYLYDGSNSRVLGFASLGVCANNSSKKCTGKSDCSGGSCNITTGENGKYPDIVIGQPSLYDHSACNADSAFQNYPVRAPASASTLCGMPEHHSPA
jgi:hypothetical protein